MCMLCINIVQIIPNLDDKNHPIVDDCTFGSDKIDDQLWMIINLVQIIPSLEPSNYESLLHVFVTIIMGK